jgi:AcrR family transcriptional regulator
VASRAEQKARTRTALIDSWLGLIGEGTNFAAVSLREVARAAGVVPTSFYRHFGDLDDLGLAVVEEVAADLRSAPLTAPTSTAEFEAALDVVVSAYASYVVAHKDQVRFLDQARTGGSERVSTAISREVAGVTERVAGILRQVAPRARPADIDAAARSMVALMLDSTAEAVELPLRGSVRKREYVEAVSARLRLTLKGLLASATPARQGERSTAQRGKSRAKKGTAA